MIILYQSGIARFVATEAESALIREICGPSQPSRSAGLRPAAIHAKPKPFLVFTSVHRLS